jgi:retron-type reverse transcriptase
MPKTDSINTNTVGWGDINWLKVERYVFKQQKRIYAASRRGDIKQVRKLQKTLMRSWSNKVLAIRRVTQDNRGRKTAGVDGVKSLSPEARQRLIGQLKFTGKSKPTRRVWIPKPGKDEKRPLRRKEQPNSQISWQQKVQSLTFIRYADDFLLIHYDLNVVQRCRELISEWLNDMGLKLKPSKTRIAHTLIPEQSEDGQAGFDFLGYHIRQFQVGKYKSSIHPSS